MHFKIIVPLYNVEKWISACLRSIIVQKHEDWQCVIVDDMSTDETAVKIRKIIGDDPRFLFVQNEKKAYALKNIYDAILLSDPGPEDVIITLDGDDWLASRDVFSILKNKYETSGCWLTYGSYAEYPSGHRGKFSRQIPTYVIENNLYRTSEWYSSHLRSFKFKLWSKIDKKDLIGSDGRFYRMAWDLAFMFPMLEMSGQKAAYVEGILYVYNTSNPLNDHKVDHQLQLATEREIRNKQAYKILR